MAEQFNPVPQTPPIAGSAPQPQPKPKPTSPINLGPPGAYQGSQHKGAEQTFIAWAKKQGATKQTAADIWYWAHQYNPPGSSGPGFAYYWTAVLKAESGLSHLNKYGQVTSSGQAVGIGQIATSHVGDHIPWEPQGVVFTGDANPHTGILNYGVNLRYSAYLLSHAVSNNGYSQAYINGYNPTDPNKMKAWAAIQKTLKTVPSSVPPLAPSSGPAPGVSAGQNPSDTTHQAPYVVGVRNGKLLVAPSPDGTTPPKNAVLYDGTPMTTSDWKSLARQLQPYFVSYTGGRPSNQMLLNYVQKGWSTYSLTVALSKDKNFTNSPIYKKSAPEYQDAVRNILPPGQKIPQNLLRSAIVNGWDVGALQGVLRQSPGYVESSEFKDNTATLLNVHNSIMGTPDEQGMNTIKQAALAGWDANQYAAYLRSQPTYTSSPEYQTKALNFLQALGLITGAQPVLKKGVPAPETANPAVGPLPTDSRVPAGSLSAPEDTVATLNG